MLFNFRGFFLGRLFFWRDKISENLELGFLGIVEGEVRYFENGIGDSDK